MEWRDIETAPRDGTSVLVCVKYNLPDGEWETLQWVDWFLPETGWRFFVERVDIPFPPTRWQPLPPPPQ